MRILLILPMLLFIAVMMTACEKQGPAERFGESVDESVDEVSDTLDDACEEVKDGLDADGDC